VTEDSPGRGVKRGRSPFPSLALRHSARSLRSSARHQASSVSVASERACGLLDLRRSQTEQPRPARGSQRANREKRATHGLQAQAGRSY
jgi:hypothetical protein